jgi:hypothetical protein
MEFSQVTKHFNVTVLENSHHWLSEADQIGIYLWKFLILLTIIALKVDYYLCSEQTVF